MHKKLSRSLFAAFVIGLAMLNFEANAATATQFVYSPLFCQTFGGALWIYPSGQIANRGTETMRVFCPLIHEAKTDHSQKLQISVVNANRQDKFAAGRVTTTLTRLSGNLMVGMDRTTSEYRLQP